MKIKQFFMGLIACVAIQGGWAYETPGHRIIDGSRLDPSEGAFFVSLLSPYTWPGGGGGGHWNPFCGGVYIGDGLILTAAHCVDVIPQNATFGVVVGNSNFGTDESVMQYEYCREVADVEDCDRAASDSDATLIGQGYYYTDYLAYPDNGDVVQVTRSTSTVMDHPEYSSSSLDHDIALIKFDDSSVVGGPINLPASDIFTTGLKYYVVGHGDTLSDDDDDTTEPSAELLFADITARSDQECLNVFGPRQYDVDNMLCAGDPASPAGTDSCQGDSGGPLYDDSTNTLVGLVSYGADEGCAQHVSVYADVFAMRNWVTTAGSLLTDKYDFDEQVRFSIRGITTTATEDWEFENTSGGPVTLSNFSFNGLIDGFNIVTDGCEGKSIPNGGSCTVTITADQNELGGSGTFKDLFTFEAKPDGEPTETLEVRLRASALATSGLSGGGSSSSSSSGGSFGGLAIFLALLLVLARLPKQKHFFFLMALAGISACTTTPSAAVTVENVYNPEITEEGLIFSVISTGCTELEDFELVVDGDTVTLVRGKPDLCRAARHLVRFQMAVPEVEGDSGWQLSNPVRFDSNARQLFEQ